MDGEFAGHPESSSPAAELWIHRMVELPRPSVPVEAKIVQALAAQARRLRPGDDPLGLGARSRVRTAAGSWLLLYATPLSGGDAGRTAVIIQPARSNEVAPLVALAYGLSERECQVTRLCMTGQSTKEIAATLHVHGPGRPQVDLRQDRMVDGASRARVAHSIIGGMYIQVSSAGVTLVDQDNFRAFAVEVVGDGVDLAGALEGIGETDGEHVYLDVPAVTGLAGDGATAEWVADLDKMIEFARSKGWVDEAGRVRAHVERRGEATG